MRGGIDESSGRVQAKMRLAAGRKGPYLVIVGPSDQQRREVSVRARGIQRNLGALPLDTFVQSVTEEVRTRGRVTLVSANPTIPTRLAARAAATISADQIIKVVP